MNFLPAVFFLFRTFFRRIAKECSEKWNQKTERDIFEGERYIIPSAKALILSERKEKAKRINKLKNHKRCRRNQQKRAFIAKPSSAWFFYCVDYVFQQDRPLRKTAFFIIIHEKSLFVTIKFMGFPEGASFLSPHLSISINIHIFHFFELLEYLWSFLLLLFLSF